MEAGHTESTGDGSGAHAHDRVADLLTRAGSGDREAAAALLPEVYDALQALAARYMAREPSAQTLQATALVHEAYMRIAGDRDPGWNGRGHFFGAAALAMRRILVERARRAGRLRHGGGRARVPLDDDALPVQDDPRDVLALDDALNAFEEHDPRATRIVMLRYFAGLTVEQTADALELSERTVRREWSAARLWLYERMTGDDG